MSTVTYYDILSLPMTASMDEVRDAYQRRLRETETGGPEGDGGRGIPRKGDGEQGRRGDGVAPSHESGAGWLDNAYKVLSNGDLRCLYDEHIRRRGCVPDPAAHKMASLNDKSQGHVTRHEGDSGKDGEVYPPGSAAGHGVVRRSDEDRMKEKQFQKVLRAQSDVHAQDQSDKANVPTSNREDDTKLKSAQPSPSWQLLEQGKPPRQKAPQAAGETPAGEPQDKVSDGKKEAELLSHIDPKTNARYEYARSADGSVEAVGYSYDSDKDPSFRQRLTTKPRRVRVLEEQLYGGHSILSMYPSEQQE